MAYVFLDPGPGGNDGFDIQAQYQMVPANGGARRMGLWVQASEPEDLVIYTADPNKAYLYGLYTLQGHAAIRGSGYFVRRDSAIRFFIGGRDPGPTLLVVETAKGKDRGLLLLSVKRQLRLSYQLAIISDPVHVPNKQLASNNLAANMLGAAKIWLDQANVRLERVGPVNDVVVPINLGDPIVIDEPQIYAAIIAASFTKQLVPADLFIYGTWDIVYRSRKFLAGSAVWNTAFVENQMSGLTGALLSAHEVGHLLGLAHSDEGKLPLLMTGGPITNDFLDMREIEVANRL